MRRDFGLSALGLACLLAVPAFLPLAAPVRVPWPGLLALSLAAVGLCLAGGRLLQLPAGRLEVEHDARVEPERGAS